MGLIEGDKFRIVLVGISVVVDSWKIYLTIRNIMSIKSFSGPPPDSEIRPSEFDAIQAVMVTESSYILVVTTLHSVSRLAKLFTNYYPFIWDHSSNLGGTLKRRAVWFSVLDDCVEKGKWMPIQFLLGVKYGGVDPFQILTELVLTSAVAAIRQAFITYFTIVLTDWFGSSGILKLALMTNSIGLLVVAVYIGWTVPKSYERLPDNEAAQSVVALATRVGYPTNRIFLDKTDLLPNAFYSSAVFFEVLIITKSLMSSFDVTLATSVVAHELGHWNYHHPLFTFLESIITIIARGSMWMMSYGSLWFINLYHLDEDVHPTIPAFLTDFFLVSPMMDVMEGIFKVINVRFEYAADGYACRVWNASDVREALVSMSARWKTFSICDSWFSAWFFGHPRASDRIQRIDQLVLMP